MTTNMMDALFIKLAKLLVTDGTLKIVSTEYRPTFSSLVSKMARDPHVHRRSQNRPSQQTRCRPEVRPWRWRWEPAWAVPRLRGGGHTRS